MAEKIYRIDMSAQSVAAEDVPEALQGLGGRGLTSTVVAAEVKPTCHPLGKYNKLVFAPGLLSGTPCANSGRLSCGAKSPLTGTIKESNAGGTSAQSFARLGIAALVIEGLPEADRFYRLHVSKDGVSIHEADEFAGKGNYDVVKAARKRFGDKIGVITIGQAGEMRLAAANISVRDPDGSLRSHGRGGLGAVMGSKKIKCITIDDSGAPGVQIRDEEKFKAASKAFAQALVDHPVTGQALKTYGTNVLINILHEAGGLPTRNFRTGQFAAHDKISGETMHEIITKRKGKTSHGCHKGCVIQCSQIYNDESGNFLTTGFEYETIWGFGANCCIEDLDVIARIDNLLDDIGVDTIEAAVTIGVAMEAGIIQFGDGEAALRILTEVGQGTPLGRLLGSGAAVLGKAYGVSRVPVVKGQGIPAYDPRSVKGIGITYATSTMGADHTAGYATATNILKVGGFVDPLKKEGQVELSRTLQIATALVDSTGLCLFVAFPVLDSQDAFNAIVDMVNARYGTGITGEDGTALGAKILKTEREFNIAAGFTSTDDRLPEFFEEPCPPHNTTWDVTNEEIDSFWNF